GGGGEGDGLIDDVVDGGVDGIDVEARAAASARHVLVEDDGDARAVIAAQDRGEVAGEGEVLGALDDAPGAEVAAAEAVDDVALGDHARLRRARTRPRRPRRSTMSRWVITRGSGAHGRGRGCAGRGRRWSTSGGRARRGRGQTRGG